MLKEHFTGAADYNAWANARLYEAAFALNDADYHRDVGAFFHSLHGTLNHILVADRIWMRRLTGTGDSPNRLDAILYDDLAALAEARAAEDERIQSYIGGLAPARFAGEVTYATTSGAEHTQELRVILAHFFNHQTHHRGQAHTVLSIVTGAEPPALDILYWQRGLEAKDLRAMAKAAR